MRFFLTLGTGLLLCATFASTASQDPKTLPARLPAPTPEEVCATGCAAAQNGSEQLTSADYLRFMSALQSDALTAESKALETLLFHGSRTSELVDSLGTPGLSSERVEFLKRELARTRVSLAVRLVDDSGRERLSLDESRLALGVKHHLFPDHTLGLRPPEISGTVKRVGLHHLWARL